MNVEAVLHTFFSRFGLTAYEENSVPDNAVLPYITYQVIVDDWGGYSKILTASLWYRDSSWVAINAKARQIADYIGYGGIHAGNGDGWLWIKKASPWAQNMVEPSDAMIKRKLLNFEIDYMTA